jgi:hypothetical protein
MAISLAEREEKSREKRSRAITSKLNLLKTRDGSIAPPIESQKDFDIFNLKMLFSFSGDENINWEHLGVDGLIRAYYYVTQKINGTTRNNIITNENLAITTEGCLDYQANQLLNGTGNLGGFYSTIPDLGRKGTFDSTRSAFNTNRTGTPSVDSDNIIVKIDAAIANVGSRGPLNGVGGYDYGTSRATFAQLVALGRASDSILGRRYSDVCPETIYTTGIPGEEVTHYKYGNNVYDTDGQTGPIGYTADQDYYNPALHTNLTAIKSIIDTLIEYLTYAKVSDTTYFANVNIIPYKNESPEFATVDGWISNLTGYKNAIVQYETSISAYWSSGNSTSPQNSSTRTAVAALLDGLIVTLNGLKSYVQILDDTTDSSTVLGTPLDPNTLRGARFLWVKTILDPAEGSKIALKGIETALASIENSIIQAEEEFGIFGINRVSVPWAGVTAWNGGLPTSEIVGIETYATIDSDSGSPTFGEMIITGYIIAWNGTDHSTAYNVWKSSDWNGSTGTWTQIIPSGNDFTVEDIDLNNGKVLSYYIDQDVNPNVGEKPYYKVVAYDAGGSGDYTRIPSYSAESTPKFYDDFLSTGSTSPFVGPSGPPPSQPGETPPYLFKWTTVKTGAQSLDNPFNTEFQSEAAFDSVGSNLEVFVDGELRHKGTATNDYTIVSDQKIKFNSQIIDSSLVTMIVYFGAGGSNFWKDPVATSSDLPTTGNADGDIRLVLDENMMYVWDSDLSTWTVVKSSTTVDISHTDLSDMPDLLGINPDHDERYPTRVEVDSQLSEIQSQLNALQFLIPEDAVPLGGSVSVSGVNFYTGYLSDGAHRFDTLHARQVFAKICNDGTFTLTPPAENQFANADVGILRLFINDTLIDYFDLAIHFDESKRVSGQVYPPEWGPNHIIEITEVIPYLGYADHQKGDFVIHINESLLVAGENKIRLCHFISPEERWSDPLIIFYDNATNTITFDSIFIDQKTLVSAKYLSGVRHYSIGDKLRFRFFVHRLFDNTYTMPNQFDVNLSEFAASSYSDNFTSSYVTSITNAEIGDDVWYDRDSTISVQNIYNIQPIMRLIGRDPFGATSPFSSPTLNILINTYSYLSDNKHEYFVDERYRLPASTYNTIPSSYTNQWNSNAVLGASDLHVYHRKLVYPQINFSNNYLPAQTINYSSYSGTRYYVRAFIDSGIPHNNGTLIIPGFTISNPYVKINIKLPSKTGWLDLSTPYNEGDFTGADGDGCLTLQVDDHFSWTSSTFSTSGSGYMIIVRVQMLNSLAPQIGELSIDW